MDVRRVSGALVVSLVALALLSGCKEEAKKKTAPTEDQARAALEQIAEGAALFYLEERPDDESGQLPRTFPIGTACSDAAEAPVWAQIGSTPKIAGVEVCYEGTAKAFRAIARFGDTELCIDGKEQRGSASTGAPGPCP